jgi:TRAP-type C4-dicarboxylate transport system permease small subunit
MTVERTLQRVSEWLEVIAGVALLIVMLLSGTDVVGRSFGKPVPGAYEIISFAGGIVLGFAIPASVLAKAHVIVDLVTAKLSPDPRYILHFISRLMGAGFLWAVGYALVKMAGRFKTTGDVTAVLQIPFYPVAYGMGGAFFVTGIILIFESIRKGGADA